jgi:hypothetical protein
MENELSKETLEAIRRGLEDIKAGRVTEGPEVFRQIKTTTKYQTGLYFEAHVTLEPVFDDRLEFLRQVAKQYHFRVADLLMQKSASGEATPSQKDSFCTARSKEWRVIESRTRYFVNALRSRGFKVYRYKIENTIVDSKIHDEMELGVQGTSVNSDGPIAG